MFFSEFWLPACKMAKSTISRLELNSPEQWSKPVRYNPLYWLVDRDPYHGYYNKTGIDG